MESLLWSCQGRLETAFLKMIDVISSHRSLHRPAPATLSVIRHPLINEYKTEPNYKGRPILRKKRNN